MYFVPVLPTRGESPVSNYHTIAQSFSSTNHEGGAKPREFDILQEVPHVPFIIPYEMHPESQVLVRHDAKTVRLEGDGEAVGQYLKRCPVL